MGTASLGLTDWDIEPTVNAGLAVILALYVVARRRGIIGRADDVSAWMLSPRMRTWLFGAGVITFIVALDSPVDRGGDEFFFWIHMVQHLLLMMVAPPLVLLGIAGARLPGGSPRVRRVWLFITRPWMACFIFNAVMLTWHVPSLYQSTLTVLPLHILEHMMFVATGFVFWWSIVDPLRGTEWGFGDISGLTKIAMLVVAGVPPTLLGFIFVMAPHAMYPFYAAAPRIWGISAVGDQQIAGVIMLGLGNLIYFAAIVPIFLRLLGDPDEDEAAARRALA